MYGDAHNTCVRVFDGRGLGWRTQQSLIVIEISLIEVEYLSALSHDTGYI